MKRGEPIAGVSGTVAPMAVSMMRGDEGSKGAGPSALSTATLEAKIDEQTSVLKVPCRPPAAPPPLPPPRPRAALCTPPCLLATSLRPLSLAAQQSPHYIHAHPHAHAHAHARALHLSCTCTLLCMGTTPARLAMHTQELLEVMKAQTDLLKAKT